MVNEPLSGRPTRWLAYVTKREKVFVDWGPELGMREVVARSKPLLHCVSTTVSRSDVRRCMLGSGYLLSGTGTGGDG